ncbi:MAG: 2-phosphosulfolactate phosphatase, partial [Gemmatimonadota bacterium]
MSLRIAIRLGMKGGAEASARGDVVIVVDVLRASSTIVAALASGMRAVVPVQATTAAGVPPEWITAGERDGRRIPGFQHGNSPLDLASRDYRDRTLYLTTTNGTAVIGSARGAAGPILVGALLNATA